jgi:hypothetical protein
MHKFSKKQFLIAGAAAVVVAAGSGAAYAYWTSSGTGHGSATTGTSSNFVVTVDDITAGDLTPGGPADTVGFSVKNPGIGVQNLASATATVAGTSDDGCTAADFAVSGTDIDLGEINPGDTVDGTFTVQMINRTGVNQDACKGVTVDLQVDVS